MNGRSVVVKISKLLLHVSGKKACKRWQEVKVEHIRCERWYEEMTYKKPHCLKMIGNHLKCFHTNKKGYMRDMNQFRGKIPVLKGWNNFKRLHLNTKDNIKPHTPVLYGIISWELLLKTHFWVRLRRLVSTKHAHKRQRLKHARK